MWWKNFFTPYHIHLDVTKKEFFTPYHIHLDVMKKEFSPYCKHLDVMEKVFTPYSIHLVVMEKVFTPYHKDIDVTVKVFFTILHAPCCDGKRIFYTTKTLLWRKNNFLHHTVFTLMLLHVTFVYPPWSFLKLLESNNQILPTCDFKFRKKYKLYKEKRIFKV